MRVTTWMLLWLLFLFLWCYPSHGECQPVTLRRGEGVDWNCRLFRRVTRNGQLYIERLRPDRTVISIEAVDCSKAVLVEGGWMEVPMHIITGSVYCYTAPRRKHEVHGGKPRENERASNTNHPAH